jgi:hypothetical protein
VGVPAGGGNVTELTVVILPCHEAARGRGAKLPRGLRVGDAERVRDAGDLFAPVLSASSSSGLATPAAYSCHRSRNPVWRGFQCRTFSSPVDR